MARVLRTPLDDEPLTDDDLAAIREGLQEKAAGEVVSHEEVKRLLRRWDLDRLVKTGEREDRELAEHGLAEWVETLFREDAAGGR